MQKTLKEIANLIEGEVIGDGETVITGFSGIKEARRGDLTFLANSKYTPFIQHTQASAIITPRDMSVEGKAIIRTDNPSLAFTRVMSSVNEDDNHRIQGIHNSAIIADNTSIGQNVNIGPFVVIENGVKIGDNTSIHAGCYIGADSRVGQDCQLYMNITVREKTAIGDRVTIHSGTVIGTDGFGYINVEGNHEKIPQIGIVEIHDDVEIGSNVTIDRARFEKTVIGRGTKIDNLVQIAHNVKIGENCIIVSQVGISGSCTIENNVILAGQVGLAGHLTIGEGSIVAAGSGVSGSVPPNTMVWGFPAKPHQHAKRVNASVQRLPHYVKTINELKKRVEQLQNFAKAIDPSLWRKNER